MPDQFQTMSSAKDVLKDAWSKSKKKDKKKDKKRDRLYDVAERAKSEKTSPGDPGGGYDRCQDCGVELDASRDGHGNYCIACQGKRKK